MKFRLFFVEAFQKAVLHTFGLIARHGVQRHSVDAAENAVFDVGILTLQAAQQSLDLLPFGTAAAVVAHRAVFGEAARALDEFQHVVLLPRDDVLLVDEIGRAHV